MHYIIRYSEIALKGQNRKYFEKMLITNLKDCAKFFGQPLTSVTKHFGRIIITGENLECLRIVFGVASMSHATRCERDLDVITQVAIDQARKFTDTGVVQNSLRKSFRVRTTRMDKTFPHKSPDISRHIAFAIEAATGLVPDLHNGEHEIGIEIASNAAYVYFDKIDGFGGLPVGTGGTASMKLETDDDVLAALLVMKRGVKVHVMKSTMEDESLQMLLAFGASMQRYPVVSESSLTYRVHGEHSSARIRKPILMSVRSQRLKSLESYSPSTLYPLITKTIEDIQHELATYRSAYNNARQH